MRTPLYHYDVFNKHDEFELLPLARQTLSSCTTAELMEGCSTDSFDRAFHQLGSVAAKSGHAMVLFERHGQNIYLVGPRVADALSRTDLTGVTPEMVKPPQRSFYVALAECPWKQWGGEDTQWHRTTGIYVADGKRGDPTTLTMRRGLHFAMWGAANERSHGPLDDILYWFSVILDSCPEGRDLEEHFAGQDVMTTEDVFGINEPFAYGEFASADEEVIAEQRRTVVKVFRMVINLMLYLQSEGAEIKLIDRQGQRKRIEDQIERAKSDGKKKKYRRKLDNVPTTQITYIGPQLEGRMAEHELRRVLDESEVGVRDERSSPRRHLVRPHWHHYWVGKGKQKRVRRWVGLFERGKGEVERTVHKIRE